MDSKRSIPGLKRNENDVITVIATFLIGMLVLLCTIVIGLHFLSSLPPTMIYWILFAVAVFAIVCLAAFVKSDISSRHAGPPKIKFSNPARPANPRRRRAQGASPAPQRIKPLP